jgi:hypothetical protein
MKRHNFIGLAYQFWNLTREAITEMDKLDNRNFIVSDYDPSISEEESRKNYEFKTRWNDFNVGVPILFNFYHGLELYMKGLLQEIGELKNVNLNHGLKDLLNKIIENEDSLTNEIVELLKYYLGSDNPFYQFFLDNNGDVDKFYLFLRYPTPKSGETSYIFNEIRGNEQVGLERFRIIKKGCVDLKQAIVNWQKNVAQQHL